MADQTPQSFANHSRLVPMFHYVGTILFLAVLLWKGYLAVRFFSVTALVDVVLIIVLGIVAWYARTFALGAQDRVIRLEERLRLAELLPAELKGRIGELSMGNLIALRFASDGEVAGLVRQILDGKLKTRTEIKQAIKTWRADHHRV